MDEDAEALELLKQLLSPDPPLMIYLHYDPITGKIINLRNYLEVEDDDPHITVPVTDFESEIFLDDYLIVDDAGVKKILKRNKNLENLIKIDDKVHQIPKKIADPEIKISQVNYNFDLLVEQDNAKKEFRIRFSGAIKDQYHKDTNSNKRMIFYVTAENDPNILYKTLDIPLVKLLQYHYYTIQYNDFEELSCNIFSIRYFQNYLHLVIE